jgi:hypothetical protein
VSPKSPGCTIVGSSEHAVFDTKSYTGRSGVWKDRQIMMKQWKNASLALAAVCAAGLATARSAQAFFTCLPFQDSAWTDVSRCPAPDQNRGFSQGFGTFGQSNRVLTITVAGGNGTLSGITHGFGSTGRAICSRSITAGFTGSTGPNECKAGLTQAVTINYQ